MTKEEIISKVNEVLAEEFELDAALFTPDALLKETLGMDSLDLVDVVVLIDQNFGVTLQGTDFIDIKTFADFYQLLDTKING
ncbi:MAG: phosphopantetheine-binding protein [Bacteroides sp.]|nr:phosphopantetheine-binding protein [Bacteroides sp.]MCM1555831.1 phosphopantetheine-binding protein [Bacteroides sp.]